MCVASLLGGTFVYVRCPFTDYYTERSTWVSCEEESNLSVGGSWVYTGAHCRHSPRRRKMPYLEASVLDFTGLVYHIVPTIAPVSIVLFWQKPSMCVSIRAKLPRTWGIMWLSIRRLKIYNLLVLFETPLLQFWQFLQSSTFSKFYRTSRRSVILPIKK